MWLCKTVKVPQPQIKQTVIIIFGRNLTKLTKAQKRKKAGASTPMAWFWLVVAIFSLPTDQYPLSSKYSGLQSICDFSKKNYISDRTKVYLLRGSKTNQDFVTIEIFHSKQQKNLLKIRKSQKHFFLASILLKSRCICLMISALASKMSQIKRKVHLF